MVLTILWSYDCASLVFFQISLDTMKGIKVVPLDNRVGPFSTNKDDHSIRGSNSNACNLKRELLKDSKLAKLDYSSHVCSHAT